MFHRKASHGASRCSLVESTCSVVNCFALAPSFSIFCIQNLGHTNCYFKKLIQLLYVQRCYSPQISRLHRDFSIAPDNRLAIKIQNDSKMCKKISADYQIIAIKLLLCGMYFRIHNSGFCELGSTNSAVPFATVVN